jgi:hypothetical protein
VLPPAPPQLLALVDDEFPHSFLAVVDKTTLSDPEHPVLVIDLDEEEHLYGREFRSTPEGLFSVAVNLDLANMDFSDFADSVDDDRVFRGF